MPSVVTYTCNLAISEEKVLKSVASIPDASKNTSVGGWIGQTWLNLGPNLDLTQTNISSWAKLAATR